MTTQQLITSFDELVARATQLATGEHRTVLGVAGSPGAGKSTLVEALVRALPAGSVAHVPMDGFHLADVTLTALGRLSAKGAPDTFDVGGYVALLRRLRACTEDVVYAPGFHRDLEQALAGAIAVPRTPRLVITEGNYLLLDEGRWGEVAPELDEVWFCAPRADVRREQLVERHVRFGKSPAHASAWVARVDEPNAVLVEGTRPRADVLVTAEALEALGQEPRGEDQRAQ